jgi:hypothetical protein
VACRRHGRADVHRAADLAGAEHDISPRIHLATGSCSRPWPSFSLPCQPTQAQRLLVRCQPTGVLQWLTGRCRLCVRPSSQRGTAQCRLLAGRRPTRLSTGNRGLRSRPPSTWPLQARRASVPPVTEGVHHGEVSFWNKRESAPDASVILVAHRIIAPIRFPLCDRCRASRATVEYASPRRGKAGFIVLFWRCPSHRQMALL